MTNAKYILIFSIGPVQSFIAQARKTHDLFAGSRLLSKLCAAARDGLNDWEIILPSSLPGTESMLNRFVAVSNALMTKDVAVKNAEQLETLIQNQWFEIWGLAKKGFGISESVPIWDQQIKSFLDIHWVVAPIMENEDYETAYSRAERLAASSKNIREFSNEDARAGRKCSLDGEVNVAVYRKGPWEINRTNVELKANKLFDDRVIIISDDSGINLSLLGPGEGIGPIGMMKRCFLAAKKESEFPSTAEISLFAALDAMKHVPDLKEFIRAVDGEYQLFYEENLENKYLEKYGFHSLVKQADSLKEKRNALVQTASEKGFPFCKYYALLLFDGDSMGEWFSGRDKERKPFMNLSKLKDFQHFLSGLLAEYAKWTEAYLVAPKGRVIYSGGDDFLGFINLESLFPVLKEFREKFREMVDSKIQENANTFGFTSTKQITFSGGLIIAHYKYPLNFVIDKARELEKIAKKQKGKDSIAIGVTKHSGSFDVCAFPWQDGNGNLLAEILGSITESFKENYSDRFFRTLFEEFPFTPQEWKASVEDADDSRIVPDVILNHELRRLFNRSVKIPRLEKEDDTSFSDRKKEIHKNAVSNIEFLKEMRPKQHINFLGTLSICEFIHRNIHTHARTDN